jgi:hypothetical protein
LVIALKKIQPTTSFQYLGYTVELLTIHPQKSAIQRDLLKTLNDFQKLLGDIKWLRPSLGIQNYKLNNFFSILEGDTALDSPQTLTPAAKNKLQFFESWLWTAILTRFDPLKPFSLLIFPTPPSPTGILAQEKLSFRVVIFKT